MIYVPASSAASAAPLAGSVLLDALELFIGADLPNEEIARTLDVDP